MRQFPVLAALLCLTAWMSVVYATQGGGRNCCMLWSTTRPPIARIVNYTIQSEGACPVKAIMFKTILGKTICSNPDDRWAIRARKKVDEEEAKRLIPQQKEDNEDVSSSDITPAASTMSKNLTSKRNGKGRKRQGNRKGKKGKRRQRKPV